jgi:hypothetical protein
VRASVAGGQRRLPPETLLEQPPVQHARMDEADDILEALRRLEQSLAGVEGRLAAAIPHARRDDPIVRGLDADAARMRSEVERMRRDYAAHVAAHLRC